MSSLSLEPSPPAVALAGKYLTFALGQEEYGLPVLHVREIIGFVEVTVVPRTPPYVSGVINLRGQVIAIMDLRSRLGMAPAERSDRACIIVVEVCRGGRRLSTGLVVDRVSEVLSIAAEQIEPPPAFGDAADPGFVLGMGKVGRGVKILLDLDRVLPPAAAGAA